MKRPDFEKATALIAHREVLEETLARTRTLLETIDKTAEHLKGGKQMTNEEMFVGFTVAAGKDRFDENFSLPINCKLSGRDTGGALSVFEMNGRASPRHLHHEEDEWVYVVDGSLEVEAGDRRFRLVAGESLFLPRKVGHGWASVTGQPVRTIHVYQPAGRLEEFFRRIGRFENSPIQEVPSFDEACRFFEEHGMKLLGPRRQDGPWTGAMMTPPASPDLPDREL